MNLAKVEEMQLTDSDISSHYKKIYEACIEHKPKLIVELGVSQSGNSSKVFSLVNEELGSNIIGVDIVKCPYDFVHNGVFVCRDDIEFAKSFKSLVTQPIDILMIDTSHQYEHTKQEITSWFPFLSQSSLVMFHDTNLRPHYRRENGTSGVGWDSQRGVIRAIEEFFDKKFDETEKFSICLKKDGQIWKIKHVPWCNGFLMAWKTPVDEA